jgi:hypothetical protein
MIKMIYLVTITRYKVLSNDVVLMMVKFKNNRLEDHRSLQLTLL